MGLAKCCQLLNERLDAGPALVEGADDLGRLRPDSDKVALRKGRLPIQINCQGSADDDEREQQSEDLALQGGNLVRDFGTDWFDFRFVHGSQKLFLSGFRLGGLQNLGEFRRGSFLVVSRRVIVKRLYLQQAGLGDCGLHGQRAEFAREDHGSERANHAGNHQHAQHKRQYSICHIGFHTNRQTVANPKGMSTPFLPVKAQQN